MRPAYSPLQQIENVLAALLLSLVWLMPNHQLPWSAFHHELVMGVMLGWMALVLAWQTPWRLPISVPAVVLLLVACVPWLQWFAGLLPKAGTAAVSSVYVGALALAFVLGHAARLQGHRRLLDILFAALALAAALNVVVQWIQWMQWYSTDFESFLLMLVTPLHAGARPSGMILQANQLATVQVWGLIGLTWFRHHRVLSLFVFGLLFVWIGIGLGLTQSRAGLLEGGVVFVLLVLALRGDSRRSILAVWLVGLALLVAWSLYFREVAQWIGIQYSVEARLTAVDGARIDAWRAFWAALLEQPWLGYGLTDVGRAYVSVAHLHPEIFIGERFGHAHNVILDVLLWFGLPLGLCLLGAAGFWLGRRLWALRTSSQDVLPVAFLCALLVHSMLELPHQFLYFLAPAGFVAGWLMPSSGGGAIATLPRPSWWAAGGIALGMAAWISADYFPYQERYTEWRFENNRIGKRPDVEVHEPRILNQIHDELVLYRMPMKPGMKPDELRWIADTAGTVSSPPGYYAAAKAFALNGDADSARIWMMRFNAVMGAGGVPVIQSIWSRDQMAHPSLAALKWPDYRGRQTTFQFSPSDRVEPLPLPIPDSHGVASSITP
ncbi:PglL family O-oligosaccharyltransferase [Hydrogenophaga laconesensis]|uniref:O-antigen ligase n=1 Tax=Hydrogenophaga laconesensis TaxID=1805971 RepID=A0ABU1VCM4_9BURK|nr:Wzy polymerase domain-containing protein [Hydrogenophaga laconesensis]MDR7095231.1 O-antigen ligase [Hydrogenophaga laconesensis]